MYLYMLMSLLIFISILLEKSKGDTHLCTYNVAYPKNSWNDYVQEKKE
jgi:hypothetical protein